MCDMDKPFIFTVIFSDYDFICKNFATRFEANDAMTKFLLSNHKPVKKVAVETIF